MKMFISETHSDCDNMHDYVWSRGGKKECKCRGTWRTAGFPFLCTVPWQEGTEMGVSVKGWGSTLAQLVISPHTLLSWQAGGWLKRKAWLPEAEFSSLPCPNSSSSQERWDNSAPFEISTLHGFFHPVLTCKPWEDPWPWAWFPTPPLQLSSGKGIHRNE